MKLCLVYNPMDSKLRSDAYCSIFKEMFDALIQEFNCRQFVTENCSAQDIDADLIFFFDPHSSHHVEIEGVDKHPAIKMEYWNDLHQSEMRGVYQILNQPVHKLGMEQRVRRVEKRGINFIVSPVKYFFYDNFYKYFGDQTTKMLLHFPHAPKMEEGIIPFNERKQSVLGNGATWGDFGDGYGFRRWAFEQPYIHFVEHYIKNKATPKNQDYRKYLSKFCGALALCSVFPVPKYFEIPSSGCATFAEYHKEYEELGFKDYENCIYVNKENFEKRVKGFLGDTESHQGIGEAGYKLMKENYSANHFAKYIRRVLC